jgi:N-acylglucosamine 2-epimerase
MLAELSSLYRRELLENVVPFWMRHSPDPEFGGYFTCLDRDGSVFDTRKYVWLNGRQVWMLSRLYNDVERRAEWLSAAESGASFLRRHAFDPEGRCYFSLTREGLPAFFQRKPYSGLFVMLGFLEYAKASGDAEFMELARALFWKVREWTRDWSLLGRAPLEGAIAYSQLSDIYALCSMALELSAVEPDPRYDAVLADCLRDIQIHFVPGRGLLHECATLDPARRRESPEGRLICAGSIFEICWFLFRALDRLPDPALEARLLECVEGAMEFAWDKEHGGFRYFQDLDGRPTLQLESQMKLWWVHAEAIYCLVAAYARTREPKWLRHLARVHEWTWNRFRDPDYGEWFGYLDRQGKPALTLKGNNYKGCFHIPRALLFSVQAMERLA